MLDIWFSTFTFCELCKWKSQILTKIFQRDIILFLTTPQNGKIKSLLSPKNNFVNSMCLAISLLNKSVAFTKFLRKKCGSKFPHMQCEKREIHCHAIFSVKSTLVIYLVKALLSRNFCERSVIRNYRILLSRFFLQKFLY